MKILANTPLQYLCNLLLLIMMSTSLGCDRNVSAIIENSNYDSLHLHYYDSNTHTKKWLRYLHVDQIDNRREKTDIIYAYHGVIILKGGVLCVARGINTLKANDFYPSEYGIIYIIHHKDTLDIFRGNEFYQVLKKNGNVKSY